jgi:nitroreductase
MRDRPAAAVLAEAAQAAGYAPSIHNTQPWRWLVHDDVLELYADRRRGLPQADPDGRLLTISCGAALHHALVALAAAGWTASVERRPSQEPDLLARLMLSGTAEVTPEVMHAFQNLELRHTDRRPVLATPPDPSAVQAVRAAATTGGVDVQLLTPDQVDQLGSACARANEVEIGDPSQRFEMAYWVGGDRAAGTGMDPDVIPAESPSGAVPGRDFARTGTLNTDVSAEGAAAYLMLFGSGDEPADWLRAGEALSAGWLTATGLGLSVLPFSAVIEVASVRESLRRDILAGLGNPYIVVRLGVPDPDHGLAARTPRLPAEQTITVDHPHS